MFGKLMRSRKWWASMLGMVACTVAVAAGWDDARAEELTKVLVTVYTVISGVFVASTAVEDAAAKRSGDAGQRTEPVQPVSIERGAFTRTGVPKVLTLLLLSGGLLVGNVACSTFDPGGQTAKAVAQRSQFLWDENNAFATDIDGAQTGAFTMYQGAGPPVLKEDGAVDWENSPTTYYLKYEPKADAAREAFQMAYQQSTLQMQMQLQTLNALIGMIGARLGVGVGADGTLVPPVQQPAAEDKWSARLDRLEKLVETVAKSRGAAK